MTANILNRPVSALSFSNESGDKLKRNRVRLLIKETIENLNQLTCTAKLRIAGRHHIHQLWEKFWAVFRDAPAFPNSTIAITGFMLKPRL